MIDSTGGDRVMFQKRGDGWLWGEITMCWKLVFFLVLDGKLEDLLFRPMLLQLFELFV